MTQSRMDRTPTVERAKKDLTFQEKIQQIFEETINEMISIILEKEGRCEPNDYRVNNLRILGRNVLRLYAEDQEGKKKLIDSQIISIKQLLKEKEERKQQLQQIIEAISTVKGTVEKEICTGKFHSSICQDLTKILKSLKEVETK